MKKIAYLIALLPLLFQSCLKEEEDIFGKDPSVRMDEALSNYKQVLAAAENGWILEYYAEEQQSYGGWNFALKFTEAEVTAWSDLSDDPEESYGSLFQLIDDDGPVLSFDTYNPFLHYFTDPSSDYPDAFRGDYEFMLMGMSADQQEIRLKGKKSGNRMVLKRLTETPEAYLTKVLDVIDESRAPAHTMVVAGAEITCSLNGNILSFSYSGANEELVSGQVAFCYTPTGIRLYQETEINGVLLREFTYANDVFTAVGADATITLVFTPLNEQFVAGDWFMIYSTLGTFATPYWDYVKEAFFDDVPENLDFAFVGSLLYGKFGFNFSSSGYRGLLGLAYELDGEDQVTLQFSMSGEGYGVWYHNNAEFGSLLIPFGYDTPRTFTLTTDSERNPTVITLTENANPDNAITLHKAQLMNPYTK